MASVRPKLLLLFFVLGGALQSSYAQEEKEKLPPTLAEFKYAVIHLGPTEREKEEALEKKKKEEQLRGYNNYITNLKKELGQGIVMADPHKDLRNHPDALELMNCVNNFADNASLKNLQKTVGQCQTHLNNMSKTDWDLLQAKGIKNPEEFRERMKNELEKLKEEVDQYNKPDEVAVISNYLEMDEVNPDNLALLHAIDPSIVKLSTDVQAVLVDYYRSPDLQTFMLQREANGESVGKEELVEFTQILNLIHDQNNQCWTNGSMSKLNDAPIDIGQLKGFDKDQNQQDIGQFLLGVQSPKDFQKIDGYKFNDGENTYYFYHGKRSQLSEDVWVMAKINPEGEMSFRYYRFNEGQERKVLLSKENDIKILESKLQQTTIKTGENSRIYFQAQEGMVVQGDKTRVPIFGETTIPQDKLIIGQVRMAYITPKTLTQSTVSFDSQHMTLGAQTQPSTHNMWSAGAGVRFSPMNQRWQVSGNVRVMNLMLGYADNLSGEKSGSVNYVIDQNYMGVSSNLENGYNLTAGRQFKSGRGGVSASTNFNNIHEIRLVIFLDPLQKKHP